MTKPRARREGPLKVHLEFDEAIARAARVKPPPGGWAAYEKSLKRERKKRRKPPS